MAVTAPNAPTVPTVPAVPKVELKDGGTVHIKNGKPPTLSDEQRARESVATGNGALSKTTVNGDKKTTADEPKTKVIRQDNDTATTQKPAEPKKKSTDEKPQEDADERTAFLSGGDDSDRQTVTTQPQTTTEVPRSYTPPGDGHGALYWGFSILSLTVAAFVVMRAVMKKKKAPMAAPPLFPRVPDKPREEKPRFEARV